MHNEKVAMLATQIVISAISSTQINLGSAEEVAKFYDAVSKQIYQTDVDLSKQARELQSERC